MAKHAAPRTRSPLWALTLGAVTGAAIAATAVTLSTPATVEGTAHSTVQEDQPGWDRATMGNRLCGPTDVGTELLINGQPWVITVSGLEPVGAN